MSTLLLSHKACLDHVTPPGHPERPDRLRAVEEALSHERFHSLPVVILTTRGDDESRESAIRDGATLYLTKPFTPSSFAPEIRRLLDVA